MDNKNLTFGYLGAMGVALIAVFLPWVSISLNVPDLPAGLGSGTAAGFHCLQGVLTLLCALAGGALAAMGPSKLLGAKAKWVMTGIGGAIVVWAVINFLVVHNSSETKMLAEMGGDKVSIGAGLGTWLALIAGIAGAAAAWMIDWTTAPVLLNAAATQQGMPAVATPAAPTPPVTVTTAPPTAPNAESTSSQSTV